MKNSLSTAKQKRGQDTREKIIKKAVDLFHEHGFAKASTRQLVRKVGMTSSAIYNHFANKEEILFIIIQRAGDKVLVTLEDAIKRDDDPEQCLKSMISGMLYLFKGSVMGKEIAIFVDELYQLPKDLREMCNKQHRQIFELFLGKIRELQEKKRSNPINETVVAFGILGAMNWVYHWFRETGDLTIEDIAEDLTKLLFDGLMRADRPALPHTTEGS